MNVPPEGRAALLALGATIVALSTVLVLAGALLMFPSMLALIYVVTGTFGLALIAAIITEGH